MATAVDPEYSRKAAALMHSAHVLALPPDQFIALRDALDAASSVADLPPHFQSLFDDDTHAAITEAEFRPELHPRGRSGEWISKGIVVRLRGGPRKWTVVEHGNGYAKIVNGQAFERVTKKVPVRDLAPWHTEDKADPGTPPNPRDAAIFQPGVFKGIFHGFKHGGLAAEVTSEWGNGTGLNGVIYNEAGDQVGNFAREVAVDEGEVRVHHDTLTLDPEARGAGFGTAFFEHSLAQYPKLGVDKVTVHAASTVGGYAWAKAGFDLDWNRYMLFVASPAGRTHLWGDEKAARAWGLMQVWQERGIQTAPSTETARNVWASYVKREYGDQPPGVFDDFVSRFPTMQMIEDYARGDEHALDGTFTSPAEIATFGREHKWIESNDATSEGVTMWLGKRFLTGSSWYGEIRLTPRPEAEQ